MEPVFIDTDNKVAYYDFPDWCDDTKFILKEGMEITSIKRYDENGSVSDLMIVCDMTLYSDDDIDQYCQRYLIVDV